MDGIMIARRIVRISGLILVTAVTVAILFAVFKISLFHFIGWHDGLNLDWYMVYYPALQTADPFSVPGYFNPPWLAWMLSPLGLLTAVDAHVLWIVLILLITTRCVYALGGDWFSVVLTIISPGFLVTIMNGQIDVLVLLGLLTGSWLLIAIKPQVTGLAIVYDAFKGRVDWTAVLVTTVTIAIVILYMTGPDMTGPGTRVSIAPWPWGIPVGLLLFAVALLRRDKWLAALCTFFVVPYFSGSSLLVYSAIGTSKYGRVTGLAFAAILWGIGLNWFI